MNELNVVQHNGVDVIDSRDVAQMVERKHNELMKTIRSYITYLNEGEIPPVEFFVESTYRDGKGETRPCYLLTKKGCDMVANKMTGEKGVLFTAAYVTAFEAMREQIQKAKPMTAYQEKKVATMERNSRIQAAKLLNQIAANYEGTSYQQVLQAHATKELTGDFLLPLPKLEAKTYSAKEIGDILGISAHRVGVLANQHGLKDDRYGQWFKDKSPYGDKEVSTFRYYASAVEKMREVLAGE